MKKLIAWSIAAVLVVVIAATVGGSFYMLNFSLTPETNRGNVDSCFGQQFSTYPETRLWTDSLKRVNALRDTFITMPTGERHHARYVKKGSSKTALIIHGWRDCSVEYLWLARLYERELGYNVVMPDLHAHGLSEGGMIQMGWLDRKDALRWLSVFQSDTMVVHGVSMGAATAMMMSGEEMPETVRAVCFVEDCGYTSVWDEFAGELKNQFGLPAFPLMYTTSLLCKLRYGWSFREASAISEVGKSSYPMLFIHGERDTFVPTQMVHRLYQAKPGKKELWIAKDAEHAQSYLKHKEEYLERVKGFLERMK
jgi:hypothetical protein